MKTSINIFAGAYGEEVKDSGSDDEDNSVKRISTVVESVSTIFEDLFDSSPVKVAHGDEIIANAEVVRVEESNPSRVTPKRKYKSIQHVKSLYDDLNDRIREDSQTHEVLLEAENKSYSQSGHTSFNYSAEEYHKNTNLYQLTQIL